MVDRTKVHPCCLNENMRHDYLARVHFCCLHFPKNPNTWDCSGGSIVYDPCPRCGPWRSAKAGPCGIAASPGVLANG